jgi:hypothetical protein
VPTADILMIFFDRRISGIADWLGKKFLAIVTDSACFSNTTFTYRMKIMFGKNKTHHDSDVV